MLGEVEETKEETKEEAKEETKEAKEESKEESREESVWYAPRHSGDGGAFVQLYSWEWDDSKILWLGSAPLR